MTPHRTLTAQPLTAAAVAPYGEVLALRDGATRPVNAGTSQRIDLPSALSFDREGGAPMLAVFRAQAQDSAGPWSTMERHRLGTQSFIPLQGSRCLLLVALGGDAPDPATLAAFQVAGDQGFTLKAGIWHHPLLARDAGDFLVIERTGESVDCEVLQLAEPVRLHLA